MVNQNRVNGTQPKFAECCKQDVVLLNIQIICINYWTTSGTSLNKTPRDYHKRPCISRTFFTKLKAKIKGAAYPRIHLCLEFSNILINIHKTS